MKRVLKSMLAALALGGLLAAGTALAQEAPRRGGMLVVGSTQQTRVLNAALQSGPATVIPSAQLFASLVRFDAGHDREPQPYLASAWKWADDHRSITFTLREGAVFHDGQPITSEDVAFSIMAVKANTSLYAMLDSIERVDTPDPLTAVVHLSRPNPALLYALSPALAPIMPKHIYATEKPTDLRTHPRNTKDVVGSGPFMLERFVPGKELLLKRFDKFFIEGRPYLDKVLLQTSADPTTLMLSVPRGDVHLFPFIASRNAARPVEASKAVTILEQGYAGAAPLHWLELNTARKPFDDRRVRQAIAYAIDKKFIVQAMYGGWGKPAIGPLSSSSPFAVATNEYPLDLDRARTLLDEAGLKPDGNGVRFKMTVDVMVAGQADRILGQYAQSQLKKIGIDAQLRISPDFPTWAQRMAAHDFDMSTDQSWTWVDPAIGVNRTYLSSNIQPVVWTNNASYKNPQVDHLLEQASAELDPAKRKALYQEFQQIVTEDSPLVYVAEIAYHTVASTRVGNPPTGLFGMLAPLDEVWLKP
ncbi:ABC transporter substrate-binding protein [Comamonas faecalis]|uniref:ABC transporter substrate-binding protein n=1 Tax=Comamonas faecalis TaxID=1387849 RepID=A0ABP7S3I3_9BURK